MTNESYVVATSLEAAYEATHDVSLNIARYIPDDEDLLDEVLAVECALARLWSRARGRLLDGTVPAPAYPAPKISPTLAGGAVEVDLVEAAE